MKKYYAVFIWDRFYPLGGWGDFHSFTGDLASCKEVISSAGVHTGGYQVVDVSDGTIMLAGDIEEGEVE